MVCKNTEQKQKHGKSGFESRTDMPKPGITGIRINSNTSGVMMMHMHKKLLYCASRICRRKIWRIPSYSPRPFK